MVFRCCSDGICFSQFGDHCSFHITFTFHIFCSFPFSLWYVSGFLLIPHWSLRSPYAACPQLLLYVWLAITCLSVCIWKSHRIFAWLFSSIFRGGAHFDLGTSSPYSVQMYSIVCQLYLVMYTLATSILPQVTTTHLCSGSKRHHRPSSTGCVSDLLCSGVEPRAPGKSIHAEYKRMW